MNEEKRQLIHKIIDMKMDGKTYQEIGDELGVSKQYVKQLIIRHAGIGEHGRRNIECIYPGLKKYLNNSFKGISDFSGFLTSNKTNSRTKNKLLGISKFNINDITKLVKESGKTFEYLFLMTEEQVEEFDRENQK